jgi:hypothetical protein
MTLREQLVERRRQWEAFNRWEEQQPPLERTPARIVADLGAILSWIPEEDRLRDPDPEKRGIQILRAACAVLDRRL